MSDEKTGLSTLSTLQPVLKVIEFKIGAGHTVNLGNFNSIKIEAGLTIAVQEGSDLLALRTQAQDVLRNMLEETYRAQRRGNGQGAQKTRQPGEDG